MSRGLRLQDLAFLGRVGNAGVTPLSFPGLHRWYKADSYNGIAADGESVGGGANMHGPWVEQTGSGDDAVGSGIFQTNEVGIQPIIQFNFHFTFLPGVLNDFTVFWLSRISPPTNSFLFNNTVSGHQLRQMFFGVRDVVFYAGGAVITSSTFTGVGFDLVRVTRSAGTITFHQNQTARGGGFENTPWTVTQLGTSSVSNAADVGEILIYNTALSTANADALYTEYLQPKWGLP